MKGIGIMLCIVYQCIIYCDCQGPVLSRTGVKPQGDSTEPSVTGTEDVDPKPTYVKDHTNTLTGNSTGDLFNSSTSKEYVTPETDTSGSRAVLLSEQSNTGKSPESSSVDTEPPITRSWVTNHTGETDWLSRHSHMYLRLKAEQQTKNTQSHNDKIPTFNLWKYQRSPDGVLRLVSVSASQKFNPPVTDSGDAQNMSPKESETSNPFSIYGKPEKQNKDEYRNLVEVLECMRSGFYANSTPQLWQWVQPIEGYRIEDESVAVAFNKLDECYRARRTILFDHYKRIISIESRFSALSSKLLQRFDIEANLLPLYEKYQHIHSSFIWIVRRRNLHLYNSSMMIDKLLQEYHGKGSSSPKPAYKKVSIPENIVTGEIERCIRDDDYGSTTSLRECIHKWELSYSRDIFDIESFLDFIWMNSDLKKEVNMRVLVITYFDVMFEQLKPPECLRKLKSSEDETLVNEQLKSLGVNIDSIPYF